MAEVVDAVPHAFPGPGRAHLQAVTAASIIDLATSFTGSNSTGMRWLIDHLTIGPSPPLARSLHDKAMRLANPCDDFAALRHTPGGEAITAAWAPRRREVASYRAHLTTRSELDPGCVLKSLLHMHHIRTIGIDERCEHVCYRLARSAALAWAARNRGESQ